MTKSCATCEWFDGTNQCHKNPPPWIKVQPTDWCGGYMQSEKESRRKIAELEDRRREIQQKKRDRAPTGKE